MSNQTVDKLRKYLNAVPKDADYSDFMLPTFYAHATPVSVSDWVDILKYINLLEMNADYLESENKRLQCETKEYLANLHKLEALLREG